MNAKVELAVKVTRNGFLIHVYGDEESPWVFNSLDQLYKFFTSSFKVQDGKVEVIPGGLLASALYPQPASVPLPPESGVAGT